MTALPKNTPEAEAKKAVAWAEATRRGQFCLGDLAVAAGVSDRWISHWARGWEADGKVRLIAGSAASRTRLRFEVVPDREIATPMSGDAIEQMWTVIRKSPQGFTPTDLLAQIAIGATLEDARAYCHSLLTAGYLRCVSKAVPKTREAVYRLIRPTGVKAPRVKRLRCMIDLNSGQIIPMVEVRHG